MPPISLEFQSIVVTNDPRIQFNIFERQMPVKFEPKNTEGPWTISKCARSAVFSYTSRTVPLIVTVESPPTLTFSDSISVSSGNCQVGFNPIEQYLYNCKEQFRIYSYLHSGTK